MDPLPAIITPPDRPKPPPAHGLENTDLLLISAGASALVATQLFGRTYPHLATETFKNVIGGGNLNLRARPIVVQPNRALLALILAPAPVGWIHPTAYGLPPNYLAGINKTLTYDLGLPTFVGIPESHMLRTLPDSHPTTVAERYEVDAKKQLNEIQKFAHKADAETVLDLYRLATSNDANKLFYDPDRVIEDARASLFAKVGREEGLRRIDAVTVASAVGGLIPAPVPAAAPAPAAPVPVHFPTRLLPVLSDPTAGLTVRTGLRDERVGALGQRPSSNLQAEAANRAPPLLRELASERADP